MALTTQLLVFLGGLPTSNASANVGCSWLKGAQPNTKYYDNFVKETGTIVSKDDTSDELEGKLNSSEDILYSLDPNWKGEGEGEQCRWQQKCRKASDCGEGEDCFEYKCRNKTRRVLANLEENAEPNSAKEAKVSIGDAEVAPEEVEVTTSTEEPNSTKEAKVSIGDAEDAPEEVEVTTSTKEPNSTKEAKVSAGDAEVAPEDAPEEVEVTTATEEPNSTKEAKVSAGDAEVAPEEAPEEVEVTTATEDEPEPAELDCDWFQDAKLGDRIYDTQDNSSARGVIKNMKQTLDRVRTRLTVELDPNSKGHSEMTEVFPNPCLWQPEDVTVFSIQGEDDLKLIEETQEDWDEDDDEPELKKEAKGLDNAKRNYEAFFNEHKEGLLEELKNHPMHRAAEKFKTDGQNRGLNRDDDSWKKAITGPDVPEAKEAVSIFAQLVDKTTGIDIEPIQDGVDEIFGHLAKADALASFLNIESPILADIMSHVGWLQPALQATRSKKITVAARHLLEAKMTFLETFLPPSPITDLITIPNKLLGVLNSQYQDEQITFRKLARDIVPLTVNSVVAIIGNAHLTDARDIFLITERVLREDTLTELDVSDIFVIGAAATRVASTVSVGIFPPASVAFGFVTSAIELANTFGLFQDENTEKFLDSILEVADKSKFVQGAFDFGQKLLAGWDAFNAGIQAILSPIVDGIEGKTTLVNTGKIKVLPIEAHIDNTFKAIGKAVQQIPKVIRPFVKGIKRGIKKGARIITNIHKGVQRTSEAVLKGVPKLIVAGLKGAHGAIGEIFNAFTPKRRRRRSHRLLESDIIA